MDTKIFCKFFNVFSTTIFENKNKVKLRFISFNENENFCIKKNLNFKLTNGVMPPLLLFKNKAPKFNDIKL